MSFPKVWKGEGASEVSRIVGEARVRALRQVDAPFLSVGDESIGFISRTANGFDSVETFGHGAEEEFSPYMLIPYAVMDGGNVRYNYRVFNDRPKFSRVLRPRGAQIEFSHLNGAGLYSYTYVGDGFVIALITNFGVGGDAALHYALPVLLRISKPASKTLFDNAELYDKKKSSTFFTSIATALSNTTDPESLYSDDVTLGKLSVNVCGYDPATDGYTAAYKSYSAGVANTFINPGSGDVYEKTYSYEPVLHTIATADMAATQQAIPYFAGMHNLPAPLHCLGPGRLGYILMVKDYWPTSYSWVPFEDSGAFVPDVITLPAAAPPYLALSEDYGNTWSTEPLNFLTQYLPYRRTMDNAKPDHVNRFYRHEDYERLTASDTALCYAGEGVILMMCPVCVPDGPTALNDTPYYADDSYHQQRRSMLFRRSAAGVWSRLSWPLDNWTPGATVESGIRGEWYYNPEFSTKSRAFGVGCVMVMVTYSDKQQLLYTRDFGDTWSLFEVPEGVGYTPTVVEPFVSEESPGRILMFYPVPDGEKKGIYAYETTGLFDETKDLGRVVSTRAVTLLQTAPAVYTGEHWIKPKRYKPFVNTAFPGEFDRP